MPERKTVARATRDKKEGKSASTQAGEFVKEQVDRAHAGKGAARSTKQAIAIGLSEARRAGVKVPAKKAGSTATKRTAADRSAAAKKAARTRAANKKAHAASHH
ncbi:DUF6496 domain-containing protein [Bordetella sp. N]|uniref:DUF6496 domain-containing protein n=1 Tax=Bordetella sp. N TaxID=1746199 RepID=UPI0007105914|nr:hypothetical protein ASB57_15080 [Bordetella sp. N]